MSSGPAEQPPEMTGLNRPSPKRAGFRPRSGVARRTNPYEAGMHSRQAMSSLPASTPRGLTRTRQLTPGILGAAEVNNDEPRAGPHGDSRPALRQRHRHQRGPGRSALHGSRSRPLELCPHSRTLSRTLRGPILTLLSCPKVSGIRLCPGRRHLRVLRLFFEPLETLAHQCVRFAQSPNRFLLTGE